MGNYFIVLIETASNQRTIFQTNRLRENLGASELIHRVGTRYVLEALRYDGSLASRPSDFDSFLQKQPRIEGSAEPVAVEIVVATSGKAILIVGSADVEKARARAKAIVAEVTRLTLMDSPGVTARGAIVELVTADTQTPVDAGHLDHAIYLAHLRLDELASLLPSNDLRFPRLPFVEDCASSGMPASEEWTENEPKGAIAAPLAARRRAYEGARERLLGALD